MIERPILIKVFREFIGTLIEYINWTDERDPCEVLMFPQYPDVGNILDNITHLVIVWTSGECAALAEGNYVKSL